MTTTPLNVDLLEEDDDEDENIGAETNAVQPQVVEESHTGIDFTKAKEKLKRNNLLPGEDVDLSKPWNEKQDTHLKDSPWYEKLSWFFLAPDFDQRQLGHVLETFEKAEENKWNVGQAVTNFYTEGITRGFKHELTRMDSPGKFAARVPYLATRAVLPKDWANTAYLGTGDAVLGAVQNVADWDWGKVAKVVPGFDALALLPEKYQKGSYLDKGFGWTDTAQRAMYTQAGFIDPVDWTEEQVAGMEARSSFMLNAALAIGTMGVGNAVAGSSTINTAAPWLAKSARWLNPSNAKTLMGGISRLSIVNILDEVPSTWLDRNEAGSAASFLSLIGIDWDPATEPGLTKWEAAEKAFLPNLVASTFLGITLNALPLRQGIKDAKTGLEKLDIEGPLAAGNNLLERAEIVQDKAKDWIDGNFHHLYRAIRSKDKFYRRTDIRNNQIKNGLIEETSEGGYKQGSIFEQTSVEPKTGEVQKPVTAESAEQALKDKYIKPENAIESDALEEALDGNASNTELAEIQTRVEAGENVVKVVDEVFSRPPAEKEFPSTEKFNLVEESEEGLEFELTRVDELTKEQLDEVLADKKILARIKKLTGKVKGDPWVSIDRIDIARALKDLQENDGLVIQRTPDVYEEAMENVRRINENLNAEKVEGEAPIEKVDTRGFEREDAIAYQRLVNAIDKAIGSEWKGGIDTAGDVLNVLNVARVTLEEGVQRALRDFARVTTSLSGRRLDTAEQIPGGKAWLVNDRRYRQELLNGITKKALENGEARPPSTTLPNTPEPGKFDSEKVIDELLKGNVTDEVIEALDSEARLIEEHGKLDAAIEADKKIAERRVNDYESKTYEQKKAEGDVLPKPKRTKEEILDQQRRMDSSPAAKRGRKRIEPGTPHPDDPRKIRGYDGRWVTKPYFRQVTAAREAAKKISDQHGGISKSYIGPDTDFTGGRYDEQAVRQELMDIKAYEKVSKEQHLLDYGAQIETEFKARILQSEKFADEMLEAIKDSAIITGIDPKKILYLNEIDPIRLFGLEQEIGGISAWRPEHATFMARNPNDPLTKVASGETVGLFVPDQLGSPDTKHLAKVHKSMILLALHPQLGHRLGGWRTLDSNAPRWFGVDAAHESFHVIQRWLDALHLTKYQDALYSKEGLAEMVKIIKEGGGNYQKGMDAFEIQAEAFGVWFANRKVKLKSGPIKSSFERLKMFLSSLRRKINILRKKDPSFVDVFELAASGAIARKGLIKELGPKQLEGLVPRIDAALDEAMPDLTMAVFKFLEAKKFAYDELLSKNNSMFYKGGCT